MYLEGSTCFPYPPWAFPSDLPDAIASLVASRGVSFAPQQLAITAWAAAALWRKQESFFAVVAGEAMKGWVGGFHGDRTNGPWVINDEISNSPQLSPMFISGWLYYPNRDSGG